MSNEVRDLLHGAAAAPSSTPDVARAWRQGRRMRARRIAVSGLAVVAIVAIASVAIANIVPSDHSTTAPAGPAPTAGPSVVCARPSTANDIPKWAASAHAPSGVPHL